MNVFISCSITWFAKFSIKLTNLGPPGERNKDATTLDAAFAVSSWTAKILIRCISAHFSSTNLVHFSMCDTYRSWKRTRPSGKSDSWECLRSGNTWKSVNNLSPLLNIHSVLCHLVLFLKIRRKKSLEKSCVRKIHFSNVALIIFRRWMTAVSTKSSKKKWWN